MGTRTRMIWVGTSGWQYRDWRGAFYPEDVPQKRWLEAYAERFVTVESNNAFYRLPERDTFAEWRDRTPDDFRYAVKMSRFLTHIKRLKEPEEPVARFLDRAEGLGDKLGPVLLQLPPNLKADAERLATALAEFPDRIKVAVEPRHDSWWNDEIRELLTKHGAALCWADRGSRPVTPLWRTADFGYVRLHHGRHRPGYGRGALSSWVERIAEAYARKHPVYVYFNNDAGAAAPADAAAFARLAKRHDLRVSRAG
ncbi:MAG: DUF72 domain-containing protein [Micromonosporaceae bacterium]